MFEALRQFFSLGTWTYFFCVGREYQLLRYLAVDIAEIAAVTTNGRLTGCPGALNEAEFIAASESADAEILPVRARRKQMSVLVGCLLHRGPKTMSGGQNRPSHFNSNA